MARNATGQEDREKSRRIGALRGLWPFMKPYRRLILLAGIALVLTSMVSLALPLAVRRVVDGFETSAVRLLDS